MRKCLAGVWVIATCVAACNGFGSEDDEQPPPPATPTDNATPPPIDGKPIPGIYVSASKGKAGASGFPGSPVNTLKEGLARAKAENLRLIVCAEEYAENVEVIDGVSAYGYFDCNVEPWARVTKRAIVKAPVSPAMIANDIKLPTRIEGFDILGPDLDGTTAVDREGTSIALRARKTAPNTLVVSASTLRGGKGAAGADGTAAPAPTQVGTARGTEGIDQSSSNCTAAMISCSNLPVPGVIGPAPTCGNGEPAPGPGGNGGDGMWFIDCNPHPQANNNQHGRPLTATAATAVGGVPCESGPPEIPCGVGAAGAAAAPGENGANGEWRFDEDGFILGNGTRGKSGAPGQGGGGGGGAMGWFYGGGIYSFPPCGGTNYFRSARGGSGGAGGCGGLAGGAGGGGGASIGALLIDAPVTFEAVFIESSNGGRAGSGALGSVGKSGGAGGDPLGFGGGRGGDGGRGGVGGSSGHGAAGPSIALVWIGPGRPIKNSSTELRPGSGGEGRPAVSQPLGPPLQTIPAAPIGASIPEYEIKP